MLHVFRLARGVVGRKQMGSTRKNCFHRGGRLFPRGPGRLQSVAVLLILCFAVAPQAAEIPKSVSQSIACRVGAPTGVAVDGSGNIYVTESSGNRLAVYDKFGTFLRERKDLNKPTGVAVDPWGRIYVCNTGSKTVDVYDGTLAPLFSLGLGAAELVFPTSVAVDSSGTAFVADSKDNRIKVFNSSGSFLYSFGGRGSGDGYLNFPVSVAINEPTSEVIVADLQATMTGYRGAGIQVFARDGTFRRRFGGYGEGQGFFIRPMGLAVDGSGRIYISDSYQNVVQVFDANGGFLLGVFDRSHPVRTPMGLAYCRSTDRLFVASLNTARVEVFGNNPQGDSGGGQTGSLSFFRTGIGGCSVAGDSRERGYSVDAWLFLGIALILWRIRKLGRMARPSK